MKKHLLLSLAFLSISFFTFGQNPKTDSLYMQTNYSKSEHFISMRDGIKLYTIIYTPKNTTKKYPFLMNRTCYNASGNDNYKVRTPSPFLIQEGYILVYQDVRGRYMSEGVFDNMRPNIPGNNPKDKKSIDESSDTWDTIEWLLKNIKPNNGRVGMFGISYPGYYAAAALPDAHPALKAVSPQAPIADFFFDDFHHMGTFLQSYTAAFAVFGYHKTTQTKENWYNKEAGRFRNQKIADGYDFHLKMGPLKNFTEKYHFDNFFWNQIVDHPNYDSFWQDRNILPHLRKVTPAVMTVGGWFDAEDLYGPLNIYKSIERNNPTTTNTLVMGPWAHGDWARERGKSTHNHIYFGDSISTFYQKEIERNFFGTHLKDQTNKNLPEAYIFDTGSKKWQTFETWPPKGLPSYKLYFNINGVLSVNKPASEKETFEYTSDPMKPVPYTSQTEGLTFTPRRFMSDDQREASKRPDVLTFESEPLTEDMILSGEIMARLQVAMTGTDADFIVKLIDVYPQDHPNYDHNPNNIIMGGYQQLVRHETFRGRFRNSFEKPQPFVPNEVTKVEFPLQDILHTFKKGHRIMIQIHSTWFPYIDRNPQNYVDNIYKADASDFIKSTITIMGTSVIEIGGEKTLSCDLPFQK